MTHLQTRANKDTLRYQITQEILRQVQKSFNLAHRSFQFTLIMAGASAFISVMGVALILSGKASQGTVATTSGLASGTSFMHLSQEAKKQLEQANKRMDLLLIDID